MKSIETYSIDKRVVELLRRYSQALSVSKSSIVEAAIADYSDRGGPSDNLEGQHQRKSLRLNILEEERKNELVAALKGSRSISLKEVGDRNE